MKELEEVSQAEVLGHWDIIEKEIGGIAARKDILFPLVAYSNLKWHSARIENSDIPKMFIISSDDWSTDGLCIPNFKLLTAVTNYKNNPTADGKYQNIRQKELLLKQDINSMDTKLIVVADKDNGEYTVIEGNKRSVALQSANILADIRIFLGVSSNIKNYFWARHTYY